MRRTDRKRERNRSGRRPTQACAWIAVPLAALLMSACGGGSGPDDTGTDTSNPDCAGDCASATTLLTEADVLRVIAQAAAEAQAQEVDATIAVVDRVGNVLAVYRMGDRLLRTVLIASEVSGNEDDGFEAVIDGGLEGILLPVPDAPVSIDDQAAIAKAVTGAYLSSEGNAFSTRTAGQIVQENFNPGELNQPSGPLFGVQFSQLACSDLTRSFADGDAGPKRSPLGLSADPGGFPLYKNGTVVGGVGVLADGRYSLDRIVSDLDRDIDELIAYAATFGFAAPIDRRGDRITVEGKTLRFSDIGFSDLAANPADAPDFADLGAIGALIPVTGYSDGTVRAGVAFGTPLSGIRAADDPIFAALDAFILVDEFGLPRFPPADGTDGAFIGAATLTADEVSTLLFEALTIANRARAQIRRPLSSSARVTISVVDTRGAVLGIVRSRDAPVFGADVSLQKARTAAFFSSAAAADFLTALPDARYLVTNDDEVGVARSVTIGDYVSAVRTFLGDPDALGNGAIAFSDRAGGNLSRPFFPDGIEANDPGPFSKPAGEWSPFSTGLQLDIAINAILQHVLFVAGAVGVDVGNNCAGVDLAEDLGAVAATVTEPNLANGLQIFPGSVPIYRGETLVGGIGVSGDGIDQDDMIAFLGLHNAGEALSGDIGNAPAARRADTLTPQGTRLRYVQCPQAPFIGDTAEFVCDGK